jgi:2-succinyl-5-enolpyruvyl-6-hydroxy-3-cyclohexene-1-carboxylate synthase
MAEPRIDVRGANALWASVLVETLFRCGVTTAVISPGSRSAPLVFGFAGHPGFEAIPVLDERSAAFFALGIAKRKMKPVALVCTSGTAGANYYPAVIEAQEAGVPLLVLTADRPPELRACGSGQTIDQQKLYGSHVNFFHELAMPEASLSLLAYLRQTAAQAVQRSLVPWPGPVHLNVPFRDPLVPTADAQVAEAVRDVDWKGFFGHLVPPVRPSLSAAAPPVDASCRGVVIAGPAGWDDPGRFAEAAGRVSAKLGWPLLADGLSPCRNFAALAPHLVTRYDALLRTPEIAKELRPESVIVLGEWPTSKVLRAWANASDAEVLFVSERPDDRDALHGRTRHLTASVSSFAESLSTAKAASPYAALWAGYEGRAVAALDKALAEEEGLIEPKAAWILGRKLPQGAAISAASSMPVRDLEFVWPANDLNYRVYFNRGANGIDGTLSSALGVAHGGGPSALLTGDLAFLHDTNGLLLAKGLRGSLTVVVINNRGGGIFEHLPVAKFGPVFEDFFATPQEVVISKVCEAHGVPHFHVEDWSHFESLVAVLPSNGLRVLEIAADRKRDAEWRRATFAFVGKAR